MNRLVGNSLIHSIHSTSLLTDHCICYHNMNKDFHNDDDDDNDINDNISVQTKTCVVCLVRKQELPNNQLGLASL